MDSPRSLASSAMGASPYRSKTIPKVKINDVARLGTDEGFLESIYTPQRPILVARFIS